MSRTTKSWVPTMANTTFLSLLQFMACLANTGWSKYSTAYYMSNGVTASELGTLSVVSCAAKLIGYPQWGILMDLLLTSRPHQHSDAYSITFKFKVMLALLIFLGNFSVWLFYWPTTKTIIFSSFTALVVCRFIRAWLNASWTLVDVVTLRLLPDASSYGSHRLYASIGWGVGCIFAGQLIDVYSMDALFWYGSVITLLLVALILVFMPNIAPTLQDPKQSDIELGKALLSDTDQDSVTNQTRNDYDVNKRHDASPRSKSKSLFLLCRILYSMRKDHEFLKSLALIQVYFVCMQIIERIIFIEIDRDFQMKRVTIGYVTFASTLAEVPFFYYAKQIIAKFRNNNNILILTCHLALFLRVFCYIFITQRLSETMILCLMCMVQLFHGVTFSLMWALCRSYMHDIATKHSTMNLDIGGSVQSALGMIIVFSGGFGGNLWLRIYHMFNAKTTYYSGCLFILPSIFILLFHRNHKTLFNA